MKKSNLEKLAERLVRAASPALVAPVEIRKTMPEISEAASCAAIYAAEVAVDPSLAYRPTPARVRNLRKKGMRWERIAVRGGISVADAKRLAEKGGIVLAESYTGRGTKVGTVYAGTSEVPAA